jgi:hypothetical protein
VKWIAIIVPSFLMSFVAPTQSPARAEGVEAKPVHGREFWRSVAKNHYAVPDGQQVFPLLRELSGYLGSPDSELRDDPRVFHYHRLDQVSKATFD